MKIDELFETIAKGSFGERVCIVTFPDGSQSVTKDPYASIANYITAYLHEHGLWSTDQIIVFNTGDNDGWDTTICYGTAEGVMRSFLHDFYEGQERINLLAFTSIDNVADAIMTGTTVDCVRCELKEDQ